MRITVVEVLKTTTTDTSVPGTIEVAQDRSTGHERI
jgi:hypothetical protein